MIHPPLVLGENVAIGDDVDLRPDVPVRSDCRIRYRVRVDRSTLLAKCDIGDDSSIHGSVLGTSCRIGERQTLHPNTIIGAYSALKANDWPYSSDGEF